MPQALLSRDPVKVAQSLALSINEVYKIRASISNAIMTDKILGNGIEAFRITNELNVFFPKGSDYR